MISEWGAAERRHGFKPHLSRKGGVWWCVSGHPVAGRIVGKGRYKTWAYDNWMEQRSGRLPLRLVA